MEVGMRTRALVSGATRGIGRATASALAGRGARVGLIAQSEPELNALSAMLPGSLALPADVGDRAQLEAGVSDAVSALGSLDLVVANAGIAHSGPFADQEMELVDEMVRVNLTGTLNLVHAALPRMLNRGFGHVVVVSSGAALRAFPGAAVYGATKAAQKAFAEALRHELSGTGVSVTTVLLGEVATSLHEHEPELTPDWRRAGDGLDPGAVAKAIIAAVEQGRRELHLPRRVRLLGLNDLMPGSVDRLLTLVRGGSAAPRRY